MKHRIISFLGSFLILISICLVLPLLVAIIYREAAAAKAFCVTILIALIPALIIIKLRRIDIRDLDIKLRDSFSIVSVSWIVASLVGCLPYMLTGYLPNFFDAFFETVSGFTTTGSTVIDNIEAYPHALQFWRCFSQWLGGMGIMVLFVALIPDFGIKARSLAGVEAPGPSITKLSSKFSGTAQILYILYCIFTITLALLLFLGGMSVFDSITHAFTTMATGGFSTHSESIAYFNSNYITWVITIFMIIAGTNFNLFYLAIADSIKSMLKDEEFAFYIRYIILTTALIAFCLVKKGVFNNAFDAVTQSAFQVATLMSTTGYATADYALWPAFCQMMLLVVMLTGASSSSTAGGMKIVRVLVFAKMLKREIKLRIHDNIIEDIKLNGKKLDLDTLTFIVSFMSLYVVTIFVGTFLVTVFDSIDIISGFTAVVTCISNVGPGLGAVGPTCTFSFLSDPTKFILTIIMIAGRLELSAFFMMFTSYFRHPHRG